MKSFIHESEMYDFLKINITCTCILTLYSPNLKSKKSNRLYYSLFRLNVQLAGIYKHA